MTWGDSIVAVEAISRGNLALFCVVPSGLGAGLGFAVSCSSYLCALTVYLLHSAHTETCAFRS